MKDNKKMSLNIQLFAEEDDGMVTNTETLEENENAQKEAQNQNGGRTYTRDELNKIVNAEREKVKAEILQEVQNQKSEAEKLAKMDAEQKLSYELDNARKEVEQYKSQVNSLTLKNEAVSYAEKKGLPFGYIEDLDYAHETAESVKEKIDKYVSLRSKDLDSAVKEKLKQDPPKAIDDDKSSVDPYLKGFESYLKKKR